MIDFSHQQRRALHALLARQPNLAGHPSVETFLFGYMFVEALLQTIGRYYRERNVGRSPASGGQNKLHIDVVQRSLKFFGIPIQPKRATQLLDSKMIRRGTRSARNLRNGVVHEWSKGDFEEVVKRFKALNSLNLFVIKSFEKRVTEFG